MIKKNIVKLLFLISLALLIWPSLTLAQLVNLNGATPDLLKRGSVYDIVGIVIQTLLGFVGALFIILVIYGGFMWMIAGGDSSKVQKAKDIIVKAVIGLVIIMSSYAIVYTIISQLSGGN